MVDLEILTDSIASLNKQMDRFWKMTRLKTYVRMQSRAVFTDLWSDVDVTEQAHAVDGLYVLFCLPPAVRLQRQSPSVVQTCSASLKPFIRIAADTIAAHLSPYCRRVNELLCSRGKQVQAQQHHLSTHSANK